MELMCIISLYVLLPAALRAAQSASIV